MIKETRTMYFAGDCGEFRAFLEKFHSKANIIEIRPIEENWWLVNGEWPLVD